VYKEVMPVSAIARTLMTTVQRRSAGQFPLGTCPRFIITWQGGAQLWGEITDDGKKKVGLIWVATTTTPRKNAQAPLVGKQKRVAGGLDENISY
jgi:hypothetical protein